MRLVLIILVIIIPSRSFGQLGESKRNQDSLSNTILSSSQSISEKVDSVNERSFQKIDSIQNSFKSKTDSLQQLYRKPLNEIDYAISSVQRKLDSLTTLRLPTGKFTKKLDSLTARKNQELAELNQKVAQLKSKATAGLKEVKLPPQMQEPLDKVTQSIESYVPTLPNGKLQEFKIPSGNIVAMKDLKLPEIKNLNQLTKNIPKSEELTKVTSELGKVKGITNDATGLVKDAQSIASGKMDEVTHIDKAVEKQVLKIDEVKDFQKQAGAVNPLADAGFTGADPEAMKKQAMEMARKEALAAIRTEATDHFAGKEALLQKSMDKMTKLKGKYSEIKSMAELPKKLPNPLHDTPFIERIVPGLAFQILKDKYFLLDVNVSAMYRITPRFSAGAGWLERIAFDKMNYQKNTERVYGPRAAFQFLWTKGINFRFLPELLNTDVPLQLVKNPSDNGNREWVWSAFVGIKKDFTVYKNIKGNTEALYNLYDPQSKSPYQDRFVVRFGFEFPMKKKRREGSK